MGYTALLRPRPEALSGDIEGIIDLANLADSRRRKLEARPDLFFDLTYPTADVRRVVELLDQRFGQRGSTPGLFLFEGLKGSGKSHLLLLVHHLFKHPKEASRWLNRHSLTCRIPEGIVPVVNKFTDLPLLSVWDFVFEQVMGRRPAKSALQPSLAEAEAALGGRQVVLIFDELEQGVRVLPDQAVKAQNIAFLQMLSEWGHRSNQVTLFASIYSDQEEPGATLKRVQACRVQFAQAPDRARVVLHRIFENYLNFAPESATPIVESYLNVWRRHGNLDTDLHRRLMLDAFPFSPDLLDIMLRRVPARGGFQNVRGALGFLAHLVRLTHADADLITPGQSNILDREVAIRLGDLDPGSDLITRAQGCFNDLKTLPYASEVASATLLYTLTGMDSRTQGAARDELIRSVLRPGSDINDFEQSLRAFSKYAAYFHSVEGRYYFDREENADAKVEFEAVTKVTDDEAHSTIRALWRDELFREPAAVVWNGTQETREALEGLDRDRLRWAFAPRRLSQEDRQALYHGLSFRNQVVLLEPRDSTFNLEAHPDLLKWAKRSIAAQRLADRPKVAGRRAEYERIGKEDRGHILTQIRRAGLLYVKFEAGTGGFTIEEESLGTATSKEDVLTLLSQKVYQAQLLAEHLAGRLDQIRGQSVHDVAHDYKTTLGFPVPTHANSVLCAVEALCHDRKLGVYHHRGNFCGGTPALSDREMLEATLGDPFEPQPIAPPRPQPGEPQPPQPPQEEPHIPPPPPPDVEQVSRRIGSQPGIGPLRQAVAALMQEYPTATVARVRFTIFLEQTAGDLSTLQAAYRGSLSGPGSLTLEIAITKEGDLGKAELEQAVEHLPSIPRAEYGAELTLHVRRAEVAGD